MDPLSITTGCLALLTAVGETVLAITNFIRAYRDSRDDLTAVNRELSELTIVLELLKDDSTINDDNLIPEPLQVQIVSIIRNCTAVVTRINNVLKGYKEKSKISAIKWIASGKGEVVGLRMSLEAHRGSLNLALELMSISMSKAIKEDTRAIRDDVVEIKQDTCQIPQIMEELERLRAIVVGSARAVDSPDQNYILQQYLDNLTNYAETVWTDEGFESDRESLKTPSPRYTPEMPAMELDDQGKLQSAKGAVIEEIEVDKLESPSLGSTASNMSPTSGVVTADGQKIMQEEHDAAPQEVRGYRPDTIGDGFKEPTLTKIQNVAQGSKPARQGKFALIQQLPGIGPSAASNQVDRPTAKPSTSQVSSTSHVENITWHGQFKCKPGQRNHQAYFKERQKLSDANYWGRWKQVINLLESRMDIHHDVWANCWRIGTSELTWGAPGGFTALHQAAWYGAPKEVVQELLRLGAWRLARTPPQSEQSATRSTPYDIARDRGKIHLCELLQPVIKRPVDITVLSELQRRLHILIRETFGEHPGAHLECFFLPELEALTEFEHSGMWFPLNPELPNPRSGLGVDIVLHGDELKVVMHFGKMQCHKYCISTRDVWSVDVSDSPNVHRP